MSPTLYAPWHRSDNISIRMGAYLSLFLGFVLLCYEVLGRLGITHKCALRNGLCFFIIADKRLLDIEFDTFFAYHV